nr:60S ribosomal protein L31-like [Manis javanica]
MHCGITQPQKHHAAAKNPDTEDCGLHNSFRPSRVAPTKKSGRETGHSAISEAVAREHPISIHKRTQWVLRSMPLRQSATQISGMKEMGSPDVHTDPRLNKAVWPKQGMPHTICVRLSRRCNEDEDSPNKLYMLVTCVPVTTFNSLGTSTVDENQLLTEVPEIQKTDTPNAGKNKERQ